MSSTKKRERLLAKKCVKTFINIRYDGIQNRVSGHGDTRYRGLNRCTREEFKEWASEQKGLHILHKEWSITGNKLKDCPSIDRIDPTRGYTVGNMRWITHSENSRLGGLMTKTLILERRCDYLR